MAENEWPEDMPRMGQLMEEASLWFARMRGPDAERYRPEFEHWLALGASHRGAYNRAGEIFAMGRFLVAEKEAAHAHANDDEPVRWRRTAIAAGASLIIAATVWIALQQRGALVDRPTQIAQTSSPAVSSMQRRYTTQVGKPQALRLDDGSLVELDGGSELTTRFGPSLRELRLERGRGRFDVAHEGRSFVVLAGGGSVTARGTLFDVILGANRRVTVRLLRGAIDVARPSIGEFPASSPAIARLEPGEILSFTSISSDSLGKNSHTTTFHAMDPVPEFSVVREFEQTPLSTVVAEANKGSATSIRITDPRIGRLKVSGRFRIDDADRVAERLAALFELKAERTKADEITLRKR